MKLSVSKLAIVAMVMLGQSSMADGINSALSTKNPTPTELKALVTHNQLLISVSKDDKTSYQCLCGLMVPLSNISKYVPMALIAIEDRRFRDHHGVDPYANVRAFFHFLTSLHWSEGGSTIEQQLCKNRVLSPVRTIARKVKDATCATGLDAVMSKDEILTAYLNTMYWGEDDYGNAIYGIEQASRVYFSRSAANLTFQQSCVLIGMLKGPHDYDPRTHPAASLKRAELVAQAVINQQYLSQSQVRKAMHASLKAPFAGPVTFEPRYFADWVMKQVRKSGLTLISGMHIPIYLDVATQASEQEAFIKALHGLHIPEGADSSFVTMTPDGHVTAMGGEDDYAKKQFNAASDGKVSAASTFKLFSYLTALEKGYPEHGNIYDGAKEGEDWNPNFLEHARGRVSLVTAFALSLNIPAIRLFRLVGVKAVIATARRLGITATLREDETLALGGSEISILEMTAAYAVFANGGFRVTPTGFLGVSDSEGRVRYWPKTEKVKVVAPKYVTDMRINLRHVVTEGTGTGAQTVPGAMGKTGTQVDNAGAWFIGFTKDQVTTVWIGRPSHSVKPLSLAGHDMSGIWAAVVGAVSN